MLRRLPSPRAIPSTDLPCVVCGGSVVRWSTGGGASLAVRCHRCGTVRFAHAAGAARRAAPPLDDYRARRRAVRDQVEANVAVIADLTRGRRLLEVACAGEVVSAIARNAGFAASALRLPTGGAHRNAVGDPAFLAPLEREVLSDRIYDVVYARGAFERAPDPRALVTNLSLLLDRRGILFLTAPAVDVGDDGSIAAARRQRSAFTRGGLAELVDTAGFSIICEGAAMTGTIAFAARLDD